MVYAEMTSTVQSQCICFIALTFQMLENSLRTKILKDAETTARTNRFAHFALLFSMLLILLMFIVCQTLPSSLKPLFKTKTKKLINSLANR